MAGERSFGSKATRVVGDRAIEHLELHSYENTYNTSNIQNTSDSNDRCVTKSSNLTHQGGREDDEESGNHEQP